MVKRYRKTESRVYLSQADIHGILSHYFKVEGYTLDFKIGICEVYKIYLKKRLDKFTEDVFELDPEEFEKIINPQGWQLSYDVEHDYATRTLKGVWQTRVEIK